MWQRWLAPSGFTATSQLLISFSLGVLFSPWSASLLLLLLFMLLYEAFYYAATCSYTGSHSWRGRVRCAVIVCYVAGWIAGRCLHRFDISILTPQDDEKWLGRRFIVAGRLCQ